MNIAHNTKQVVLDLQSKGVNQPDSQFRGFDMNILDEVFETALWAAENFIWGIYDDSICLALYEAKLLDSIELLLKDKHEVNFDILDQLLKVFEAISNTASGKKTHFYSMTFLQLTEPLILSLYDSMHVYGESKIFPMVCEWYKGVSRLLHSFLNHEESSRFESID